MGQKVVLGFLHCGEADMSRERSCTKRIKHTHAHSHQQLDPNPLRRSSVECRAFFVPSPDTWRRWVGSDGPSAPTRTSPSLV